MSNRKSRWWVWVLVIVALVILAIGGVTWYGTSMVKSEVKKALNENPTAVESLGEIEKVEMDLRASGKVEGGNAMVFKVTGSKASGKVTTDLGSAKKGAALLDKATLTLDSGETVDLSAPDAESSES